MDWIDCYQNVGIKLTMIPKCKDQNDVFAEHKKKDSTSAQLPDLKSREFRLLFFYFSYDSYD